MTPTSAGRILRKIAHLPIDYRDHITVVHYKVKNKNGEIVERNFKFRFLTEFEKQFDDLCSKYNYLENETIRENGIFFEEK